MRELTPGEMLSLREFVNMETTSLINLRAAHRLVNDDMLKNTSQNGIQETEIRLRALQQFIQENNIMSIEGGH